MDTYKIENLPLPQEDSEAATKKYVHDVAKTLTLEDALIKKNGGYNISDAYINMNYNRIKNVGIPINTSDSANKGYVDAVGETLRENINKRPHIIYFVVIFMRMNISLLLVEPHALH